MYFTGFNEGQHLRLYFDYVYRPTMPRYLLKYLHGLGEMLKVRNQTLMEHRYMSCIL